MAAAAQIKPGPKDFQKPAGSVMLFHMDSFSGDAHRLFALRTGTNIARS
jgi:hypothetical protein